MNKATQYDELKAGMKIHLGDGYAEYEDGEVYINAAFLSVEDAKRLAAWISEITKEEEGQ